MIKKHTYLLMLLLTTFYFASASASALAQEQSNMAAPPLQELQETEEQESGEQGDEQEKDGEKSDRSSTEDADSEGNDGEGNEDEGNEDDTGDQPEDPGKPDKPGTSNDEGLDQADQESADEKPEEDKPKRSRKRRKSRREGNLVFTKQSERFIAVFEPVVSSTSDSVVRILNRNRQIAMGLVIDPDGMILTKASELAGEPECELADGSRHKPAVVGVDPTTDLALLKIDQQDLAAAKLLDDQLPTVGEWLATAGIEGKPVAVGIVSHKPRRIRNNVPNPAVIGIQPQDVEDGDGVRINQVLVDSPAEKAGLLVNDIIVGIDSAEILNREQLHQELAFYQPSDEIILKIKRGDEIEEVPLTLGRRRTNPMMDRGVRQNEMGSTLSERRSNFPTALQHDTALDANQCGGPIVDLAGNVVGINIARDGRVSTLALPNAVVLPVIETLLAGERPPVVVYKQDILRIERKLAQLDLDLEPLPNEKMDRELEHSAGAALEKELSRQIKEAEKKLSALKARFDKTEKSNNDLQGEIKRIQKRQKAIEGRRGPLQRDLKRLKTGIK